MDYWEFWCRSTFALFSFLLSPLIGILLLIGSSKGMASKTLLSRRSSSTVAKNESKRERVFSLLSGSGGEDNGTTRTIRPSLLRRSTTLSGHPEKDSIKINILEKSDPRLFKDLPDLPNDILTNEDENIIEKDDVIAEENKTKSKLERKPNLRKVLSSPNRLSLLRPTPLKLSRFPDWLSSSSSSRSPSNNSISPLSESSTATESSSNEEKSNEEKVKLIRKKSFNLLSPSDWLKSPSIASFRNKSMENCTSVPEEMQIQLSIVDDETFSLAEELGLLDPQSSRTSFHSIQESIIGTLPDTDTPRTCEVEGQNSGETQWSQESAKEKDRVQSDEETNPNSESDETIDQENFKEALVESPNTASNTEMLKIEEAWTAFNVSPGIDEVEHRLETEQTGFPMSVDTLTSYDKTRSTPDVCENDQQYLTVSKPLFLRTISERTASSLGELDFYSANSSLTELGELTINGTADRDLEEEPEEDSKSESNAESISKESSRSPCLSSISPTSSIHSPLSKSGTHITSIPSTPTSFTSTALSSPETKVKRFSPSDLAEFLTQSYWSEDSEEEEELAKTLKEKKVRNKRKFNKTTSSNNEIPRHSQISKRLGLIFDHPFHQTLSTNPNRKSFGGKRKGNTFEGDSPQFDVDSSFLDFNISSSGPSKKPSKLLTSLTYVPHLLRHKGSTTNLGASSSTATEMQRSKSANDLLSSYKKNPQNNEEISPLSSKIPSPTQSDKFEHDQIQKLPPRSLTSLANYPLLLSPINSPPQPQSPRTHRLSHKPSLPALLEGRTLTNDSHESKFRYRSITTSDQSMMRRTQSAQRSSWHPQPLHSRQFQDNLLSNGWTMEREHYSAS